MILIDVLEELHSLPPSVKKSGEWFIFHTVKLGVGFDLKFDIP